MTSETSRLRSTGTAISGAGLLITALAALFYLRSIPGEGASEHLVFLVPLVLFALGLGTIPLTDSPLRYYLAQSAVALCFLLTAAAAAPYPVVQLLLLTVMVGEVILYEPHPRNLIASLSITGVMLIVNVARLAALQVGRDIILQFQAMVIIPGLAMSLLGSHMTKYRELVVTLSTNQDVLRTSIVNLTRTNSAYQDYAVVAQEHATEKERQRITRDIHDIVGYTLTNNLMLMEAALDLMKENALALPSIIETARENAQEGLDQVRAAMYKLREQENAFPIGLNALVRLGRVFEQATGTEVSFDFSNMPMTISDEVDSTVYHLVQEALVNSFRHGAATKVSVSFWYDGPSIQVRIQDNGAGANAIVEGIGLAGMRERIERLGGTLDARSISDGFTVVAVIDGVETTK